MKSIPTSPKTPAAARPLWQRLLMRRLKFLAYVALVLVVVLGGSYLFAPQWLMSADVKRQMMAAHVDKHSVQVGDTKWVYFEGGQGPTLVLLHGFAASKEVWLKQMELLTPHFHVIAPDLPGWGEWKDEHFRAGGLIRSSLGRSHVSTSLAGLRGGHLEIGELEVREIAPDPDCSRCPDRWIEC